MTRPKEKCPNCHTDMYFFHKQHVCLECGEFKVERRWQVSIPSFKEEIFETMEIVGALYEHHFHKMQASHAMVRRGVSVGSSERSKAFQERAEQRVQEHGELTAKIGFALDVLRSLKKVVNSRDNLQKRLTETEDALALNQTYAERWFGKGNV